MKKSLVTHQIGKNWELLLRQADQDNGKNKSKYISLYQKFCHLFKNRLNNFVEASFKYRWRGTERWNLNIYEKSPISLNKKNPKGDENMHVGQKGKMFSKDDISKYLS